ncbi:MAG: helix-turn-helix domain-containing protein [Oscillospiraceae bacterium]|nr:helix-turn-helix domain-containing protein [Oscillospiraceae bacterium]
MIADKIRELREARGITQASLARSLGQTRNSVNSYEQGLSVPSVSTLVELCKFFNVSADYLLELDDSTNIRVTGLEPDEIALVYNIVEKIRGNK